MAAFEELGVSPEIIRAIEEDDWLLPTPIQAEAIPLILGGGDVCAAAETGGGKTGAFGIPALQVVHEIRRAAATAAVATAATTAHISKETSLPVCLNENDKDPHVCLDDDKLRCCCSDLRAWRGIRGTAAVLTGKYMFEAEILSGELTRVGWASRLGSLNIGTDAKSFGFGATGKKSFNGRFEEYGTVFGPGDIIGCMLERSSNESSLAFAVNGRLLGKAFRIPSELRNTPLYPALCGKGFDVRLRMKDFVHPVEFFQPLAEIQPQDDARFLDNQTPNPASTATACTTSPYSIILEPTRDLAQQTFQCLLNYGKYLEAPKVRVALCTGGEDEKHQRKQLSQGVDIVVGTLQKIEDFTKRGLLNLQSLRIFVLDEADELVRFDALPRIHKLLRSAGCAEGRAATKKEAKTLVGAGAVGQQRVQVLFFSATLHSADVRKAVEILTQSPTWVDLKGKATIPETVHAVVCLIDPAQDLNRLQRQGDGGEGVCWSFGSADPVTDGVHAPSALLRRQNPADEKIYLSQRIKELKPHLLVAVADALKMENCLVFCRTNLDCDNLERFLNTLGGGRAFHGPVETGKENAYSCVVLAGMRSQEERNASLAHFKAGLVRFLICTDVAARGIDIQELPYLIMMSLPDDSDLFFHRVGRVGRADRMGLAICFAAGNVQEQVWYHRCPNRGRGCSNTRLLSEGGCTVWYDEPACLKTIEGRLDGPLPRMCLKTFSVPGIIDPFGTSKKEDEDVRRRVAGRSAAASAKAAKATASSTSGTIYGKSKSDQHVMSSAKHLQEIAGARLELEQLEREMQQQYVTFAALGI